MQSLHFLILFLRALLFQTDLLVESCLKNLQEPMHYWEHPTNFRRLGPGVTRMGGGGGPQQPEELPPDFPDKAVEFFDFEKDEDLGVTIGDADIVQSNKGGSSDFEDAEGDGGVGDITV